MDMIYKIFEGTFIISMLLCWMWLILTEAFRKEAGLYKIFNQYAKQTAIVMVISFIGFIICYLGGYTY